MFLPWYGTDPDNRFAQIDGARGDQSCWDVHPILRWLLLAAAVAPFILAYIIATDTQLSWARGEMTMVTSIAALGLIFYNGVIDRPGEPPERHLGASTAGSWRCWRRCVMFVASAMRSSEHERARKPPGTI